MANPTVNLEVLKTEIRNNLVNNKLNACPVAVRLAWHAAGTFDKNDGTGGSNGATMRFEPEKSDGANAGLHIPRDLLKPVKDAHPHLSTADLWAVSGCSAVEFLGGPKINTPLGRIDSPPGSYVPPNGRLPDASQGAQHLRDVFYRMGFNDKEIVALSGAHTLGHCHVTRSGYDGPWTRNPYKFDNAFFKNLLYLEWRPRKWDGPLQYEDVETGELMMLPTDIALIKDPAFRVYVEQYAKNQDLFFNDFAEAFAKLLAVGVKFPARTTDDASEKHSADLREAALQGSLEHLKNFEKKGGSVHSTEKSSGRTALHKSTYAGSEAVVKYLLEKKVNVNAGDFNGDTALHDAVRFNHPHVVALLLNAGADASIVNKHGHSALHVAQQNGYDTIIELLRNRKSKL